jgi:predicted O-methyltransferase YrrM
MNQKLWTAVDSYITDSLLPTDPILDETMRINEAAGLPAIAVAPNQGKLLHLLARMQHAKRILEIGTLGGYSTIWLARALPSDGILITLEFDPKHHEVASANIARAGLSSVVQLRLGAALESLPKLEAEGTAPFDLIFIDADKQNMAPYLDWAIRLSRPGTVIIGDNVVREGEVIDPANTDPRVQGVRQFFELLASDPRIDATAIQTVGSKGYDGFALAIVL